MAPPQHRYEIGQKLLCFEPDASKAKVIYFAKILKQAENKSDVPHYTVHFQGWKCKWDREVPENLLLDNTEFNRTLKRRIDEIARHERCRTRRKQRIDMVLKAAAIAGDSLDWNNVPGVWVPRNKQEQDDFPVTCPQSPSDRTYSDRAASTVSDDADSEWMDNENVTQSQFENLHHHQLFSPVLLVSTGLQEIINAHCATQTGNTEPCTRGWCSVLQVLQCYVDYFPYADSQIPISLTQISCSDRVFRQLNPAYAQTDHSRLMCADVCSSLRVLFDCMFKRYLLLPEEQTLPPFCSHRFLCSGRAFPPATQLPSVVSPLHQYSSPRYELFPKAETDRRPNAPCLNYPAHFLLRLFVNLPEMLNAMNLSICRRTIVTRHIYLLLEFLDRTRHWWFADLTPKSFILSEPDYSDELRVKSDQEVALHKTIVPPVSETSSETEPQTTVESVASQPYHTASRHVTRSSGSRLGSPRLDSYDDSVTAIRLPISQEITSPTQLCLTVQTDLANLFSMKPDMHSGSESHPESAKNQAPNSRKSSKSRTTTPTSTRSRQNQLHPIASVTEHMQPTPPVSSIRRRRASEASSTKLTGRITTPPRTLRPRVSEIHYK
ncbi:Male-specific lethal 3 1 [Fasciola hepatica]|uniref:Male-specific lethal 3 1 n=1 Tax=Fasciola hepatica TaxID=6192 RepID=A0A4E0R8U1_FASHE|nr:Male-specific lethal 3 1 [Fasciola hepatica]